MLFLKKRIQMNISIVLGISLHTQKYTSNLIFTYFKNQIKLNICGTCLTSLAGNSILAITRICLLLTCNSR